MSDAKKLAGPAATDKQAKKLIKLKYKPKYGRKWNKEKAVSKKWITENITKEQAGLIIGMLEKKLSGRQVKGVSSWEIEVPARPFIGFTKKDTETINTEIEKTLLAKLAK